MSKKKNQSVIAAAVKVPKAPEVEAPGEPAIDGEAMGSDHDWEAQNHMDTLMKAEAIKSDKVKMDRVHALAGRHQKTLKGIKSVQDIKDVYDAKFGSGKKAK